VTMVPWPHLMAVGVLLGCEVRRHRFNFLAISPAVIFGPPRETNSHLLRSYLNYYNETRTHLSLDRDAPVSRAIQTIGRIFARPVLGGLHHQYVRI